ncbi:MAG: hypothetical protein L0Z46_10525 [Nitrospiraceae bacterium]|nr:hypothetical protein [Nitrospiraceae bacterium]
MILKPTEAQSEHATEFEELRPSQSESHRRAAADAPGGISRRGYSGQVQAAHRDGHLDREKQSVLVNYLGKAVNVEFSRPH